MIHRERLKKLVIDLLILLSVLALVGLMLYFFESSFDSPKDAVAKIQDLGALGPLFVIVLIALEVVVAPIPGYIIAVASGYAFGAVMGTIYSYMGNIIGTLIAFHISRRFGRPLVERLVRKSKLDIYDCFFKERGRMALWLAYLFPVFPTDIISFVTGLSSIKLKDFMLIVGIAYIPNMFILNYFGETIYQSGFSFNTLILGALLATVFLFGSLFYLHIRRKSMKKKEC